MGHTVTSQRRLLLALVEELDAYGKALRRDDRERLRELARLPLRHLGAISYASSMHAWAFLLLAALLEHDKRVDRRLSALERDRALDERGAERPPLHPPVLRG